MAENAALRALRLLDLVPYVVNNQGITILELANHFQVSKDDIVKDLNLLFLCGLPGYTPLELIDLSIEDDVVVIRDPQNLALPRNFNYSEAIVLRIALAALGELVPPDSPKNPVLKGLENKLAAMFSHEVPNSALNIKVERDSLITNLIKRAIENGKDIKIRYLNLTKDEITNRDVTPLNLILASEGMTLHGHCHLSGGERNFYVSRILEAEVVETPEIDAVTAVKQNDEFEVRFKLLNSESQFLTDYAEHVSSNSDGSFTIKPHNPRWLLRQFISLGDVEVLEPGEFRTALSSQARSALERYQS